jgi:Zn-finger nucleic acid-binding protein
MTAGALHVDVCRGGCGGVWFDRAELARVDDQDEAAGEALLDVPRAPGVTVSRDGPRPCPKCPDVVMMRHFYSPKREVEIDECGGCGGVWLDAGELRTLRGQYASEEDRRAAAHTFFREAFGGPMAEMAAADEAGRERACGFARLLRFVCPSYWIPGDQSWGAF